MEEALKKADLVLDATSAGVGAKTRNFIKIWCKGDFQGGEKNDVADVLRVY